MLMRGKSMTCRIRAHHLAVYDRLRSETATKKKDTDGKSETCRASAWPSH